MPADAQVGEWHEGKPVEVDYRIYINGFPKSGTHLVEQMVRAIAPPMPAEKPWAGSFKGNSWTTEWVDDYHLFRQLGWIADGSYAKGHMGYRRDIELFLWGTGAAVLFVYRDLRDVAVSQAHHILDGRMHPEPELFQALHDQGGFEAVLKACVGGLGVYAGVVARWQQYAGWLDVPWVLTLKFEDLICRREEIAALIARYCVGRAARHRGYEAMIPGDVLTDSVQRMVAASHQTDKSPTYRKGVHGEWQTRFSDDVRNAFRAAGGDQWLVKLGYEQNVYW